MKYIILDFDGVINVLYDGILNDWDKYNTYKLPYCNVRVSNSIIEWLNYINTKNDTTVLWLSSWLEDTKFFNMIGLPSFDYIGDSDCYNFSSWKTEYLDMFITENISDSDCIIWVDDEEDMNFISNKYSNVYPFKTDSNRGITPDIIADIDGLIAL